MRIAASDHVHTHSVVSDTDIYLGCDAFKFALGLWIFGFGFGIGRK